MEHLAGFNKLINLRELHLSKNNISRTEELSGLKNHLARLYLSHNNIAKIEGLS